MSTSTTASQVANATTTPDESSIARRAMPGLVAREPERRSLIGEDVEPTVRVLESEDVMLRVGGLVQLHAVPWSGSDALIENGDVATSAGFRLRRARFGLEGRFEKKLGILLAVNPLESDEDVGTVSDAKISYDFAPWARVAAGAGKVPFSRAALLSSKDLGSIERPLAVQKITPSRRLGLTLEGEVLEGRLAYLAAVMNATEGFTFGNRFGGVLGGLRLEVAPWGRVDARPDAEGDTRGLSLGASALLENGPSVRTLALSFDVLLAGFGGSLTLEALCDQKTPIDAPIVSPGVADKVERCGAYAEAAYAFRVAGYVMQADLRLEVFDDNRALDDTGDAVLFGGGINLVLVPRNVRAQLHYVGRKERFGGERDNDAVVFAVTGAF